MSEPLMAERLQLIRELRALITPGEWHETEDGIEYATNGGGGILIARKGYDCLTSADICFIVNAPDDVADLLAEVERLSALAAGLADRVAAQSELLSRRAEKV